MADMLLWIALISAVLGTGFTALTSSGIGRMWHMDVLELRRQQRFEHVLSEHVDATRLSRQQAATEGGPGGSPVGIPACAVCGEPRNFRHGS
ncbi:hypothetical protein [Streptomyces sp. NPDC002054]|uniref:hypothetical protein n=1 Tax=Streptomyces sp. NPDC002054 TaxID=3154663 RepID=UPI00332CE63B